MNITKATDLEKLPEEFKQKITNVFAKENVSDADLIKLVEELGIAQLFPSDRVADVFKTWLKVTGYIKHKGAEDNQISIIAWIDTEAENYLSGNKNINFKPSELADRLESRLAVISDMYLKTSELFESVKDRIGKESDAIVATFKSMVDPDYIKEVNSESSDYSEEESYVDTDAIEDAEYQRHLAEGEIVEDSQ